MKQAHRIPPLPSNARYYGDRFKDITSEQWDAWERGDPGYDQPGPIRRSDLSWQLVVEGLVVFAAIVMFVVLASLVDVR